METDFTLLIDRGTAITFGIISVVSFVLVVYFMFIHNIIFERRLHSASRILLASFFLITSVWCMRYIIGISGVFGADTLDPFEEVLNSLIHTLQSFSMDEDYTVYINNGKVVFERLFDTMPVVGSIYGGYVSVLNVICPIAGGAIIFEAIASVSPRMRLFFARKAFWREIFYFSALNDRSVAVAQSMQELYRRNRAPFYRKPVYVFTDAYIDDDSEHISELHATAKLMGAICLKDDIVHMIPRGLANRIVRLFKLNKKRDNFDEAAFVFGGTRYFLIDDENIELENLKTIAKLAEPEYQHLLENSRIYLFSQEDTYEQVEQQVRRKITSQRYMPLIRPIRTYQSLIYNNILIDMPLYEPLIGRSEEERKAGLKIAIIGSGKIGTEMLLSTYWCGQILDCPLTVGVVSKEPEDSFCNRINHVCPEILESAKAGSEILYKYPNDKARRPEGYGMPYMSFSYLEQDVLEGNTKDLLANRKSGFAIADADYIVVALGNDEDNIAIAQQIKRNLPVLRGVDGAKNTVVAYSVYDSELCRLLTLDTLTDDGRIYMYPFGSCDQTYNFQSIVMDRTKSAASSANSLYSELKAKSTEVYYAADKAREASNANTSTHWYKYWSSMARVMHIPYKLFSCRLLTKSVFNSTFEERSAELEAQMQVYKAAFTDLKGDYSEEEIGRNRMASSISAGGVTVSADSMSWLEHRRWSTFLRSQGYRNPTPTELEWCIKNNWGIKCLPHKLHGCIVESAADMKGTSLLAQMDEDDTALDSLDIISKIANCDYKLYDYPHEDLN